MFNLFKLRADNKALTERIEELEDQMLAVTGKTDKGEIEMRHEIGQAVSELLDNKSDRSPRPELIYFKGFDTKSKFLKKFETFIDIRIGDAMSKQFAEKFDERINEKFIDEIVDRIRRKQI